MQSMRSEEQKQFMIQQEQLMPNLEELSGGADHSMMDEGSCMDLTFFSPKVN